MTPEERFSHALVKVLVAVTVAYIGIQFILGVI